MKKMMSLIILLILSILFLNSCQKNEFKENNMSNIEKKAVIFLGNPTPSWESIDLNNAIVSYILEKGYDYRVETVSGTEYILKETIEESAIDILMEYWIYDFKSYDKKINNDLIEEVSVNFSDPIEGVYIPKYMIYGDEERGIKASTPGLKYLKDLPKYKDAFVTVEGEKPKLYTSAKEWGAYEVLDKKYRGYGINKNFEIIMPINDVFLSKTGTAAYKKGEPWVGFYWEPSEMIAINDFIRLEEEPYSEDIFISTGLCNFPNKKVTVVVSTNLKKEKQDVYEFLKNYKMNKELIKEMIIVDNKVGGNKREFAREFLKENTELWEKWVTKDAYNKIKTTF